MKQIHISVSPEPIAHLGQFTITNSLLTSLITMGLLLIFAFRLEFKKEQKRTKIPIIVEIIIEYFYNFFEKIVGSKAEKLFPLLFTFFIFIIFNNWVGLLPGVGSVGLWENSQQGKKLIPLFRGPSADLNTTLALALISVGTVQYYSFKSLGLKGYLSRFINLNNPIKFFVGILELISELAKIISFSFRLFGNIFAGEVLLIVITFLIPILLPVPFLILEIFVGFIQALVFTMLSSVFIVTATETNHK